MGDDVECFLKLLLMALSGPNAAGLLRPLLTHSLCLVREFQRKVLRSWVERHAGYNLQMGSWVVGLEGDFDFAKDVNYLASVRGLWALGSWLPYATAGVATAGVAFIDADNNFSGFPPMTAPSTSTPALPTRV